MLLSEFLVESQEVFVDPEETIVQVSPYPGFSEKIAPFKGRKEGIVIGIDDVGPEFCSIGEGGQDFQFQIEIGEHPHFGVDIIGFQRPGYRVVKGQGDFFLRPSKGTIRIPDRSIGNHQQSCIDDPVAVVIEGDVFPGSADEETVTHPQSTGEAMVQVDFGRHPIEI